MFILYGIKFSDSEEIYYTTKECFDEWKKLGEFEIVSRRLKFN